MDCTTLWQKALIRCAVFVVFAQVPSVCEFDLLVWIASDTQI